MRHATCEPVLLSVFQLLHPRYTNLFVNLLPSRVVLGCHKPVLYCLHKTQKLMICWLKLCALCTYSMVSRPALMVHYIVSTLFLMKTYDRGHLNAFYRMCFVLALDPRQMRRAIGNQWRGMIAS